MSVIIKGMKMPKSCDSCDLIQFDDEGLEAHCPLSPYYRWCGTPPDYRPEGCLLVEVPTPHGRLIDADNVSSDAMCSHCVEEYCRNNCECFIENVQTILSNELITPTIIEAEVE